MEAALQGKGKAAKGGSGTSAKGGGKVAPSAAEKLLEAANLETMAAALDKHQDDAKLAADLRRTAKALREAQTEPTERKAGLAYTNACDKVRKVEKRIAGLQDEVDAARARLTELEGKLHEAEGQPPR